MSKSTSCYPKLSIDTTGNALMSQSGAVILIRTAEKTGLTTALSEALSPWRKPTQHDPGKILLDLALSLAVGGDCLADIATVREQPAVFGPVASDATVSRLISTLAVDGPSALSAINSARALAREAAWSHGGPHAPGHDINAGQPLVVDLDATLVTAYSEKENTAPNFKRGFGFHPLLAFVDHGRTRHRRTLELYAAARKRRFQYRRRPHCCDQASIGTVKLIDSSPSLNHTSLISHTRAGGF